MGFGDRAVLDHLRCSHHRSLLRGRISTSTIPAYALEYLLKALKRCSYRHLLLPRVCFHPRKLFPASLLPSCPWSDAHLIWCLLASNCDRSFHLLDLYGHCHQKNWTISSYHLVRHVHDDTWYWAVYRSWGTLVMGEDYHLSGHCRYWRRTKLPSSSYRYAESCSRKFIQISVSWRGRLLHARSGTAHACPVFVYWDALLTTH